MIWPALRYTAAFCAGLLVFAVGAIFAAEHAIRRWAWAERLAYAVGLISEDDIGGES